MATNGANQEVIGRIRLDVAKFRADASAMAAAAKVSAQAAAAAAKVSARATTDAVKVSMQATAIAARANEKAIARAAQASAIAVKSSAREAVAAAQAAADGVAKSLAKQYKSIDALRPADRGGDRVRQFASESAPVRDNRAVLAANAQGVSQLTQRLRESGQAASASAQQQRAMIAALRPLPDSISRVQQFASNLRAAQANAAALVRTQVKRWADAVGKSFAGIGVRIREAQLALAAITAGAAAFVYKGLRAADSVDVLTERYRQLTTSEADALALMNDVGKAAARVGIPLRLAQKSFAGLIPQIRASGESLEDYIGLAARVATLNVEEGVGGAVFAIREALSSGGSDFVSLVERFNLPKNEIIDLTKETGSFAKALDITLDKMGATDELAIKQARSITNLSAQIGDNLNQVLERAFLPVLESVRDGMIAFNALLQATPTWVVQVGATLIVAGGAFAALALILEKVVSAFVAVKAAAIAAGVAARGAAVSTAVGLASAVSGGAVSSGAGLAKAAIAAAPVAVVTAGALAFGAVAGKEIVRLAGRIGGNTEMANFELSDAWETAKKSFFVIVVFLLETVGILLKVLAAVVGAFQAFWDAIVLIFAGIKGAFGGLLAGLGSIITSIGNIVGQTDAGGGYTNEGNRLLTEAANEVAAATESASNRMADNVQAVDGMILDLQRGLRDFMFPAAEVVDALDAVSGATVSWADNLNEALNKFAGVAAGRISADIDRRIQLEQELADIMRTATQEDLTTRVTTLQREREAIVKLLPELVAAAEYSEEAEKQLAGYNERLRQIADELPRYSAAVRAATQRAMADAQKAFATALIDAQKARIERAADIAKEAADALLELDKDTADKRKDILDREAEIDADYRQTQLKIREDHNQRLLDIERDFDRARTLAASKLDAAGVAAAINARADALLDAGQQTGKASGDAGRKYQEDKLNLGRELLELQLHYDERLRLIREKQAEETLAAITQYALALKTANDARAAELALIQQATMAQVAILKNAATQWAADQLAIAQQAAAQERIIRTQALALYLADLNTAANTLVATGKNLVTGLMANMGFSSGTSTIAGQAVTAGVGAVLPPLPGGLSNVFNINGVTDPLAVAEIVRQVIVKLGSGT